MPDTPITRGEFQMLRDLIEDGFQGTHKRLDALNGRVEHNTVSIAKNSERVAGLEAKDGRVSIPTLIALFAALTALGAWLLPHAL